ncbi:hypothetical protein DOTSEDRAFT_70313 [Dothistroma septosporum NZE10]|uniref:Uncharacterized protein n=1 Tax=Dothistroma septosporum (strain NZE10 / CBS 128990) TaxID=675120 RepID=N1PTI4_DOTSN|nr:hypothetical protein DOTSEDRAFT_70313 [Dothistroma septosporum NZE10]
MLRVIWRYACAAGHVNYSMRARLSRSLCSTTRPDEINSNDISRGHIWKTYAGKFAVGVSQGLTKGRRLEDAGICGTSPKSEEHLVSLASHTVAGRGREQEKARHAALLQFMQDDLKEVNNCMPVEPLSKMLAKAYATDIVWKEESHLGLPKALSTHRGPNDMFARMLREGINVHMRAGDFTRRARDWEAPGAIAALLAPRR